MAASPPASSTAVQDCPGTHGCKPLWDKVGAEQKRIDAIKDPQKRNQQITADYAKLYLAQPDIQWAGVAAFASKQVGCGMSPVYGMGKAGGAVAGPGNQAVYDELYPPLSFYQNAKACGFSNDEVKACLKNAPGAPLHPSITKGMDRVMAGDPAGGARTMLEHEQKDTLQKSVYDSWWTRRGLQANEMTGGVFASENLVYTAECQGKPGDAHIDFADYPGRIYDFDSRWPFAQDAARKFGDLTANPATNAGIRSSLGQLSTARYPSFDMPAGNDDPAVPPM